MLNLLKLLASNPRYIGYVVALASAAWFGWHVRGKIAAEHLQWALSSQETALRGQCADEKKTTEDSNNELQNANNRITKRLADSQRVSSMCVAVSPDKANTASGGGKHAGQNGISFGWLQHYAAECETYRSQRIVLEKFQDKVWKQ